MTETTGAASLADEAGSQLALVADRDWPAVSVVMTVLNEARHLTDSVQRILAQEYSGEIELVIALGPSRDATERIARRLASSDPRITLVTNPTGRTPAGLNAAVLAASHDIIARVDGHGALLPGYMEKAVELLEKTGAANVGGLMLAVGETGFEQAVARAYSSKAGLGGGTFHVGGVEGPAESVYLGVFRREVLERLGGFNDHYHRAQDWELNFRIRQAGELVWFSPDLAVTYRPRSSWPELVRQFFHTGRWRREVIRQYPDTVSRPLPRPAGGHRRHPRRHGRRGRRYRRRGALAAPWMAGSAVLRPRRAPCLVPGGPRPALARPGAAARPCWRACTSAGVPDSCSAAGRGGRPAAGCVDHHRCERGHGRRPVERPERADA